MTVRKHWLAILAVVVVVAFGFVSNVAAELMAKDEKTGKMVPARDHSDTVKYFVKDGVEFVFRKGADEAMKASGVSLDDNGHLQTPKGPKPYFDLLDSELTRTTKAYLFGKGPDGKLVIIGFLKNGGVVQIFCDKGAIIGHRFVYPLKLKKPKAAPKKQNILQKGSGQQI